jgi:predicted Rossmann fold flavoprotein
MQTLSAHIVIVGGGAAGMCAAIGARQHLRRCGVADEQFHIVILERNARLGIKIRISGGGKCNISHDGDMMSVLEKGFLRPQERRFLKPSFFGLTNRQVVEWLHQNGVATYTRPNGRIFPLSGKATDVLSAFENMLREHRISVFTNALVRDVERQNSHFLVHLDNLVFQAQAVILATGGVSYSKTGTTGDGLRFAEKLGHRIVKPRAALAPIYLTPPPPAELVGISLRAVKLIAKSAAHTAARVDDVLITHLGISGPATLSLSREVAEASENSPVEMFLDFFPTQSPDELELLLCQVQHEHATQFLRTFLEGKLPNALVPFLLEAAGVAYQQKWSHLKKEHRRKLLHVLKAYPLGTVKEVPLERGEVSAGGVALSDINPKTMESRLVPNFYVAGEALDIAGEVGGFNLQGAYSTGWLAGVSAAQKIQSGLHEALIQNFRTNVE